MNTKTVRLPIDLIEAAESESVGQHRSASKQLEHWARFGMLIDTRAQTSRAESGASSPGKPHSPT